MKILMILPNSPPKNGPEAIQAGRYIKEIDEHNNITVVTTPALSNGWVKNDDSLEINLKNTFFHVLKLPFHNFSVRLLGSKYCKFFVNKQPDKLFWLRYKALEVINNLKSKPDIIYSRSLPFSAAQLALKLKIKLGIPWVMHLSDPWIDSPYRVKTNNENKLSFIEVECFKFSDAITLTTESMADFYKLKFPEYAHKIHVSHNVMPNHLEEEKNNQPLYNTKLKLMYAGALYGNRKATTLLEGLLWLKKYFPELLENLDIILIGNMTDDIKKEIDKFKFPQVQCLGKVQYSKVIEIQKKTDILISIEANGDNPLYKTFMPSKVLDYMASRKPILAITPVNSPTWKLCKKGFGWAIKPDDGKSMGELLKCLIQKHLDSSQKTINNSVKPLIEYSPKFCAEKLINLMNTLLDSKGIK